MPPSSLFPLPEEGALWGFQPHALGYFSLVGKVPKSTRKGLAPLRIPNMLIIFCARPVVCPV